MARRTMVRKPVKVAKPAGDHKRCTIRKRPYIYKGKVRYMAWVVTEPTNANGKRPTKTCRNERQAEIYAAKVDRDRYSGLHVADRDTVTFGKMCKAWLDNCELRHRLKDKMAGNTLHRYRTYARVHVLPEFQNTKANKITWQNVQRFLDEKQVANGYAKSHMHGILVTLIQTFEYAKKQEWVTHNPLKDRDGKLLVRLRGEDPEQYVPETPEIRRCLEVIFGDKPTFVTYLSWSNRGCFFMLAAFLALRQGEISSLLYKNIDFKNATVLVRHSQSTIDGLKEPKTKAGLRDVPMDPLTYKVLSKHIAWVKFNGGKHGPDDYVFVTRNGLPLSPQVVCSMHTEILTKAGLMNGHLPKFTPHDLRRYAGSLWLARGMDLAHVSWLMGHETTAITQKVYLKQLKDSTRARDIMSQLHGQFPTFKAAPIPTAPAMLEALPAPELMPASSSSNIPVARVTLPVEFWGQPWLPDAIALIESGIPPVEVAKQVGVDIRKVYTWLLRAGMKNAGAIARKARNRRFRELHDAGKAFPQIAEETGSGYWEIYQWAERNHITPRRSTLVGARSQRRIRSILRHADNGESIETIARKEGISDRYAEDLLRQGRLQAIEKTREFSSLDEPDAGKMREIAAK